VVGIADFLVQTLLLNDTFVLIQCNGINPGYDCPRIAELSQPLPAAQPSGLCDVRDQRRCCPARQQIPDGSLTS
jgi:hypothetical protein